MLWLCECSKCPKLRWGARIWIEWKELQNLLNSDRITAFGSNWRLQFDRFALKPYNGFELDWNLENRVRNVAKYCTNIEKRYGSNSKLNRVKNERWCCLNPNLILNSRHTLETMASPPPMACNSSESATNSAGIRVTCTDMDSSKCELDNKLSRDARLWIVRKSE